jgi:hypothetical protein
MQRPTLRGGNKQLFPPCNHRFRTTWCMFATKLPAALLIAAALPIAACGSSSPNTTDNAVSGTKQADGLAFAACIRSHGVPNFPDPSTNGSGGIQISASQRSGSGASVNVNGVPVNGATFQKAMSACRHYLPNGGTPSPAKTAQLKAKALEMSRCMRSHGVPNFPDPQFQTAPGGGFGIRLGGPGIDPSSPAFKAAQQACGSIMGGLKGPATQTPDS